MLEKRKTTTLIVYVNSVIKSEPHFSSTYLTKYISFVHVLVYMVSEETTLKYLTSQFSIFTQ